MTNDYAMMILGAAFHDTRYLSSGYLKVFSPQGTIIYETNFTDEGGEWSKAICVFDWNKLTFIYSNNKRVFKIEKLDHIKAAEDFIYKLKNPFSYFEASNKWKQYALEERGECSEDE